MVAQNPVLEHLPLVKYIAGRIAIGLPRSVELDDLINAGVVGLIEAHNCFDPSKGVKFESYGAIRIRGAILDELRGYDWAARSLRSRARQMAAAMETVGHSLGRSPTDEEVALAAGMDLGKVYGTMDDLLAATLLSLDELSYGGDAEDRPIPLIETLKDPKDTDALHDLVGHELRDLLVEAMIALRDQYRLVVILYYYEELTLKEIGGIMELSESRVSQIHTTAVREMRTYMRQAALGLEP